MSLDPARFSRSEFVNTDWTVTVEAGTSLEDVLNSAFFANVAAKMTPYDHIRVRVDTGEWYAELLVLDCGRNWAKLFKLCEFKLSRDEEPVEIDNQFAVKHLGPHKKFAVIRKADNEVLRDGFTNKQDANVWLASHLLSL